MVVLRQIATGVSNVERLEDSEVDADAVSEYELIRWLISEFDLETLLGAVC